nr:hypothetical protein [Proteus mirabilis]
MGVRNQGGHIQADKTLTVKSNGQLVWQSAKTQEAVTQANGDITLLAKDNLIHQGKLQWWRLKRRKSNRFSGQLGDTCCPQRR